MDWIQYFETACEARLNIELKGYDFLHENDDQIKQDYEEDHP